MYSLDPTQTQSETDNLQRSWRAFFKLNCNSLFQMALLLTGDAGRAEAAVAGSIEEFDVSQPPDKDCLAVWEKAVALRSIERANRDSCALQAKQDPRFISITVTKIIDIVESERRILFLKATMERPVLRVRRRLQGANNPDT